MATDFESLIFGSGKSYSFDDALSAEGVTGRLADVAKSIYQQESGSGRNTRTSNAGAVGGMQIIPTTFSRVADKGWDINNPEHNLRAGIRYLKQLSEKAGGDPKLVAAGYYGGEGAIPLAQRGVALRDPRNPNAPDTLQYARQVESRIPAMDFERLIFGADQKPAAPEGKQDYNRELAELQLNRRREKTPALATLMDVAHGATTTGRGAINLLSRLAPNSFSPEGRSQLVSPDVNAAQIAGGFLDPAAWGIAGAASKVLPYAPVLSRAATATHPAVVGGGAKAVASNALSGALAGAPLGLLSAASGGGDIGSGAAGGAAIGAAANTLIPPAAQGLVRALELAKDKIRPSAGNLAVRAAGDKADDVIAALRAAKSPIPGVNPTVAEAALPAGSAEFAALQSRASQFNPSLYLAADKANEAGRLGAVQGIGGTKAALENAIATRAAIADPLYQVARAGGPVVDTSKVAATVDKLLADNPGNKELVSALTSIRGALYDGKTLRKDAQQVASIIDGLKATIANKDNAFIRGELNAIKTQLADAIPGYQSAQATFAKESVPVNRMQVGQALEKALGNPLGTAERASTFANAVREAPRTIKKSTGMDRFTELSEVLDPIQTSTVNNVMQSLKNQGLLSEAASRGTPNLDNRIGAPHLPATGMFMPFVNAARSWINRSLGVGVEEGLKRLSVLMVKDPAKFAEIMASASPAERAAVQSLLSNSARNIGILSAGGPRNQENK
jgi:hypothetical protein